jgi:hypothetical protein
MRYILDLKKTQFFILILSIYLSIGFWKIYFYYGEDIILSTLGQQISYENGLKIYYDFLKHKWIGILAIPLLTIIRVLYTTIALFIGDYFSNEKIGFRFCFNVSLKAEIAFVLLTITSLIFIEFVWQINTLTDLSIIPLSLLHLFIKSSYPAWSGAILSILNLWEIIYMILISVFLGYYNNKTFFKNIGFTLSTYGVALLFWIVILTYIAITLT